jgi:hypothetical protein
MRSKDGETRSGGVAPVNCAEPRTSWGSEPQACGDAASSVVSSQALRGCLLAALWNCRRISFAGPKLEQGRISRDFLDCPTRSVRRRGDFAQLGSPPFRIRKAVSTLYQPTDRRPTTWTRFRCSFITFTVASWLEFSMQPLIVLHALPPTLVWPPDGAPFSRPSGIFVRRVHRVKRPGRFDRGLPGSLLSTFRPDSHGRDNTNRTLDGGLFWAKPPIRLSRQEPIAPIETTNWTGAARAC